MSNPNDSAQVLIEIRDLLKTREEKYDQYLESSRAEYKKQVNAANQNRVIYLIWICFAVSVGVFFGGLMLRAVSAN